MMDVDHVEMAIAAALDEFSQEVKAGCPTAIGDSWGGKHGLAFELVHVLLVYFRGPLRGEVCLTSIIGLVCAEAIS